MTNIINDIYKHGLFDMMLLNQLQQLAYSSTQHNIQKDDFPSSAPLIPFSLAANQTEGYLGTCSTLNNSSFNT